jgi:hypothetical protein
MSYLGGHGDVFGLAVERPIGEKEMRNLWSEVVVVLQVFHASIEEEMLET